MRKVISLVCRAEDGLWRDASSAGARTGALPVRRPPTNEFTGVEGGVRIPWLARLKIRSRAESDEMRRSLKASLGMLLSSLQSRSSVCVAVPRPSLSLSLCVCVSVSLPFLPVCLRSTNHPRVDRLIDRTGEKVTARTASPTVQSRNKQYM